MKDVDLINEAYTSKIQQLDEALPIVPLIAGAARAAIPAAVGAGMNKGAENVADRVTSEDNFDITDDDEGNDELEPGKILSADKKAVLLDLIKRSVEEIVVGNTGPDSPCSERDALDLIVSSCQGKLHEMDANMGY